MIHEKDPQDAKEAALVAVINWREKDRIAIANKRDNEAQKAEYKQRTYLRKAADDLKAAP